MMEEVRRGKGRKNARREGGKEIKKKSEKERER